MSNQTIGIIVCVGMLIVCVVACIVQHEERRDRRALPEPRRDDRDWQGIFMKDVK